jgi:hypothetical protein
MLSPKLSRRGDFVFSQGRCPQSSPISQDQAPPDSENSGKKLAGMGWTGRRTLPTPPQRSVRRIRYDDFAGLPFLRPGRVRAIVHHAMKIPHAHRDQGSRYEKVFHLKGFGSKARAMSG